MDSFILYLFGPLGVGLLAGIPIGYVIGKGWVAAFADWLDEKGEQWGW